MRCNIKILFWILIFLAIIISLPLAYQRLQLEKQNNQYEIVMDYQDILRLSKEQSVDLPQLLPLLKKSGVTTIALVEDNLVRAEEEGIIEHSHLPKILKPTFNCNYIIILDQDSAGRIYANLSALLGKDKVHWQEKNLLIAKGYYGDISALGLGLDQKKKTYLEKMGFKVIPRVYNEPRFNPGSIEKKIAQFQGFPLIIFAEDEILGYPKDIKATARAMKKHNIAFGYVELAKQRGDRELTLLSDANFKKVHSITAYEIRNRKITPSQAVPRYVRAVKERGVRYIYFHPFDNLEAGAIPKNLAVLSSIRESLSASGYQTNSASQFGSLKINFGSVLIITLGLIAAFLLLINYFIPLSEKLNWLFFIALLLLFLAGNFLFIYGLLLNQLLALAVALIFPALAVISTFNSFKNTRPILAFLGILGMLLGITLIGALLIVALLSDSVFMIGTSSFIGAKFALFVPLLVVMLYFLAFYEKTTSAKEKIMDFFKLQVPVTKFLLALVGAGAIAIVLARSDNFVLPVLNVEEIFRGFLENLFWVRPRTKEFLIGYPLLFAGIIFYLKGHKKYLWVFLTFGALALTSLTNTFCHLHTPLSFSILRSLAGLMFGIFLGIIFYLMIGKSRILISNDK